MDFIPEKRRYQQIPPSRPHETHPTFLIQDINTDINSSIELVRRMRMEIMKLDNDLKTTQLTVTQEQTEDQRPKQELDTMTNQFQSEKEQIYKESVQLRELIQSIETKITNSQTTMEEVKYKTHEITQKINEKESEIETNSRKQKVFSDQLNDLQKKIEETNERIKLMGQLEEKCDSFEKKTQFETETGILLQKEYLSAQKNMQRLAGENYDLGEILLKKKKVSGQTNSRKNTGISGDPVSELLQEELRTDLAIFEDMRTRMKNLSMNVQVTDNRETKMGNRQIVYN